MKTKIFIAVTCIAMMQLTVATAQISTNIYGGTNGTGFSFNIGTNTNQKPTLNSKNSCCATNNNCCYSNHHHHACNTNANCCGQKHGDKKHHKKCDQYCHHEHKKDQCCKDHDD